MCAQFNIHPGQPFIKKKSTWNDTKRHVTKCDEMWKWIIHFIFYSKEMNLNEFKISHQLSTWTVNIRTLFFSVSLMNTPDYSRKMLHGRTVPMLLFLGLKGFDEQKIYNCFVMNMCLLIRAENWHQCDKDYMTQTTKPKLFDLTDLISAVLLVGILVIIGRCLNKNTFRIVIIFNFFITHSRIPGSILKFSKQM